MEYIYSFVDFLKSSSGDLSNYQSLTSVLIAINVTSPLFTNILSNMSKSLNASFDADNEQYVRYKAIGKAFHEEKLAAIEEVILRREAFFASEEGQGESRTLDLELRLATSKKNYTEKLYNSLQLDWEAIDERHNYVLDRVKHLSAQNASAEPELAHHFPVLAYCAILQCIFLIITTISPKANPYFITEIFIFLFLIATSYRCFSTLWSYIKVVRSMSVMAKKSRRDAIELQPIVASMQEDLDKARYAISKGDISNL